MGTETLVEGFEITGVASFAGQTTRNVTGVASFAGQTTRSVTGPSSPTPTDISPAVGPRGSVNQVVITGTGFQETSVATLHKGDEVIPVTDAEITGTTITGNVDLTLATPGYYDVTVE